MKCHAILVRIVLAGAVVFAATGTDAKILTAKSAEQKQRKDIQKQSTKNALCMAKALLKCEGNGEAGGAECDASNPGSSTVPDPDNVIIPRLTADLTRCESKLAYAKKSATGNPATDYAAIGCPGDSVPGGADDPFTDLAAYQGSVGAATRAQLDTLGGILAAFCPDNACAVAQGSIGLSYAKGLFKCVEKCENDYKDKKGNGGPDDLTTHCAVSGGDSNFVSCATKALTSAQKKGTLDPGIKNALEGAIADASNDLYNQDDCP